MATEEYISEDTADRAPRASRCRWWRAPSTTKRRTSSTWSRSRSQAAFPGVTARPDDVDVFTTLDLNLQRGALDAVRNGLDPT